jgi:hypothetical protein
MIRCTIGVVLLSIGAILSGRPGLQAGGHRDTVNSRPSSRSTEAHDIGDT